MTDPEIRAGGGVVWREGAGGAVEVLVVHRPKYDDWTIPKGKCDKGESEIDAAWREVEEETGLDCSLGPELASSHYIDRKGRTKTVRYWSMTVVSGELRACDEVDEARWLTPDDASRIFSYDRDRNVLASFQNVHPQFT